eukprot:TRINITY_DN18668_c0_g1_i3.p2 TRINITY_DN18668_c0_g1~~TRINITY_DN18668_c0_g1_i3.p2  ORF type:complete len:107 (-),score=12.19 TRINITY_DN18668_c0_g1_i3:225-545(-)
MACSTSENKTNNNTNHGSESSAVAAANNSKANEETSSQGIQDSPNNRQNRPKWIIPHRVPPRKRLLGTQPNQSILKLERLNSGVTWSNSCDSADLTQLERELLGLS